MYYTDNPAADFMAYDREQERKSKALPVCDYCGATLYDKFYDFGDEKICPECLESNFGKRVSV